MSLPFFIFVSSYFLPCDALLPKPIRYFLHPPLATLSSGDSEIVKIPGVSLKSIVGGPDETAEVLSSTGDLKGGGGQVFVCTNKVSRSVATKQQY